jgi:hypothetical protein
VEAAHAAAPTAAEATKEDKGTKRVKAAAKPAKKEKGHGQGKR